MSARCASVMFVNTTPPSGTGVRMTASEPGKTDAVQNCGCFCWKVHQFCLFAHLYVTDISQCLTACHMLYCLCFPGRLLVFSSIWEMLHFPCNVIFNKWQLFAQGEKLHCADYKEQPFALFVCFCLFFSKYANTTIKLFVFLDVHWRWRSTRFKQNKDVLRKAWIDCVSSDEKLFTIA